MISASKYQHIIYFMSLLKVSLCINRSKQRLLCMDTRRGYRSKRSIAPPGRTKTLFSLYGGAFLLLFFHGEGFMLHFSSYKGLFSSYGGLFATSSSCCGPFSQCGGLFCYFFLHVAGLLSSWGILCLYVFFYGVAPSPYDLFWGRMLLCNFHPMSSAINYSGHYAPNKAHCNTRVQFTIAMKSFEPVHICK